MMQKGCDDMMQMMHAKTNDLLNTAAEAAPLEALDDLLMNQLKHIRMIDATHGLDLSYHLKPVIIRMAVKRGVLKDTNVHSQADHESYTRIGQGDSNLGILAVGHGKNLDPHRIASQWIHALVRSAENEISFV